MYSHSEARSLHFLPTGSFNNPTFPYGYLPDSTKVLPIAARPLTPPPEKMNSVAASLQPSAIIYQEHGPWERAGGGSGGYAPYHNSNLSKDFYAPSSSYSVASRPVSRPHSPTYPDLSPLFEASRMPQRKSSSIAPSLQIPRSINSSQGSLSELAAQITCLFWFESSQVLQQAEDSILSLSPTRLTPDAIPTTGFRKWVTTILSTTQVAQNVVLLALLFIYRLKTENPTVKGKPGSEYRLLTVALMLGNKFLDDNTYTNKTWAGVSGISVAEVHIMEVEFLSNMKYNLFTSASQWKDWQNVLGRFAGFVERATRPQAASIMAPSPIPASRMSAGLPSPPVSFQTSPPSSRLSQFSVPSVYAQNVLSHGPTPRPSPLGQMPDLASSVSRKRDREDDVTEHAPKRRHYHSNSNGTPMHGYPTTSSIDTLYAPQGTHPAVSMPAMPAMPSAYTPSQHSSLSYPPPQLPPLNMPLSTVSYPSASWPPSSAAPTPTGLAASRPVMASSAIQSRHQSPYPGSTTVSPTNGPLHATSHAHTQTHPSPSVFLAQRNSPYKPVRGVSTLLVPPPPRAMQQANNVGVDQMHYQPLGRPNERQQGCLPYVAQNQWLDAYHQRVMTPGQQWPALAQYQQGQQYQQQQYQQQPQAQFGQ